MARFSERDRRRRAADPARDCIGFSEVSARACRSLAGNDSDPELVPVQPNAGPRVGREPSPDLTAVHAHIEHIHRLAAPLAGKGKLIVAGFGEDPDRVNPKTGKLGCPLAPVLTHIAVGNIDGMVRAIAVIASRPHYNAYLALAVFREDLPTGKKGSLAAVHASRDGGGK
jgi:hypothetical protein